MAKRQAGNRARAVVETGSLVHSSAAELKAQARDVTQALAERMAETKFAEMMSAAGVGHDRMALELLYWLPKDFMDLYQELYMRGLSNTDGGTEARGRAGAATAAVGRAAAKTAAGQKTFKRYWVVADEDALELKERIDKRLRAMTREMRIILDEMDFFRTRLETEKDAAVKTGGKRSPGLAGKSGSKTRSPYGVRCEECGVLMASHWAYCAHCGCPTALPGAR